jgi:hypothetical protein
MFLQGIKKMSSSKSGLVGKYGMVKLELKDDTSIQRKMFEIRGTMQEMCNFYEALKDHIETAVNADIREHGFQNRDGVDIGWTEDDLEDWRKEPNEIAAFDKAKRQAEREGLMRFVAVETRHFFPGSPRSWVAALNGAIEATGIQVEPEALVVA